MSAADQSPVAGFIGGPLAILGQIIGGIFSGGGGGAPPYTGPIGSGTGRGVPPIPLPGGGFGRPPGSGVGGSPYVPPRPVPPPAAPPGYVSPSEPGMQPIPTYQVTPMGIHGMFFPISEITPESVMRQIEVWLQRLGATPWNRIDTRVRYDMEAEGITKDLWEVAQRNAFPPQAPPPREAPITAIPSERPYKAPKIELPKIPPLGRVLGNIPFAYGVFQEAFDLAQKLFPYTPAELPPVSEAVTRRGGLPNIPQTITRPAQPPITPEPATPSIPFDFTLGLPAAIPELPPRGATAPPPPPAAPAPASTSTSVTVITPPAPTIPLWEQLLPLAITLLPQRAQQAIVNIQNPPPLSSLLNIPQLPVGGSPFGASFPGFAFGSPSTSPQTQPKGLTASKTPSATCTCADGQSPKRTRDQCAQGYFRQKPGRDTEYTVWSTRKCQQSSQKSQSAPAVLTQTSLRAQPLSSRVRRSSLALG